MSPLETRVMMGVDVPCCRLDPLSVRLAPWRHSHKHNAAVLSSFFFPQSLEGRPDSAVVLVLSVCVGMVAGFRASGCVALSVTAIDCYCLFVVVVDPWLLFCFTTCVSQPSGSAQLHQAVLPRG
jgi:hypothetical protein